MKSVVWFCYAAVTDEGTLKAAPWIVAAAEQMVQAGMRLCMITPGPGNKKALEVKKTRWCDVYRLSAGVKNNCSVSESMVREICQLLKQLRPDVFQIFGTEFSSYLCAGLAAEQAGIADRTVVWIQGVCRKIGESYCDGLPMGEVHRFTFRDLIRLDNIYLQKRNFLRRADNETRLLNAVGHVIGRTEFDRACVKSIASNARYHHCGEILRRPFYENRWQCDECVPCRLFMCQSDYPIKGLHILLQAMPHILKKHPNTVLYISGENLLEEKGLRGRLARQSYAVYLHKLIRRHGLEKHIVFTGYLSEEEMVVQYQKAQVYVLPSVMENSPNSLGEAMLMGVPCVAADAGGISSMLESGQEGILYEKTNASALAAVVIKILDDPNLGARMGEKARCRASVTHEPAAVMDTLIKIYDAIGGKKDVSQ